MLDCSGESRLSAHPLVELILDRLWRHLDVVRTACEELLLADVHVDQGLLIELLEVVLALPQVGR